MFILYDLVFILFALCYLPVYLFKGKFHRGFLMRLGIFPAELKKSLENKHPIWLHAVSVGEVRASSKLLEELHKEYPEKSIVISTVTPTGNKIAQSIAKKGDIVLYLPLDISFIVRCAVKLISPCLFIIAETEIWPNLISCLHKQKVPIITVNARISDHSYGGYRLIRFLLSPILNKINLFCVQAEADAQRLRALGAKAEKVKITGNMKFDNTDYADLKKDYADHRQRLGLKESDRLFVAGSTHPGEDEIVLEAYKEALQEFPDLRLLIAPRHPERAKDIETLILKFGFNPTLVSGLSGSQTGAMNSRTVFVLDIIGQLIPFYAIADIVFVGGSLVKKGGQNLLEPAALAKPIIFGPYIFNFKDIAQMLLENNAGILAAGVKGLAGSIKDLCGNHLKAIELGMNAKKLIPQNQGAAKRSIELIRGIMARL
jgi:3-deoxy-D-manno-octulosonic-acid transferase